MYARLAVVCAGPYQDHQYFHLHLLFAYASEIPPTYVVIMLVLNSGRPVWYLLACCTTLFLIYSSSVGFWTGRTSNETGQYPDGLTAVFSTPTIDALNQDPRLRSAILSLTEAVALSSSDLGERFRSDSLKNFGASLADGISHARSEEQTELKKRGFLDDLGNLFGGLAGGGRTANGGDSGARAGLNLTGGLSGLLNNLENSVGMSLTGGLEKVLGSLDQPALFLGIGLG